jgi:hypothetical protein
MPLPIELLPAWAELSFGAEVLQPKVGDAEDESDAICQGFVRMKTALAESLCSASARLKMARPARLEVEASF